MVANAVGQSYGVDGNNLERYYKNYGSDFSTWEPRGHCKDYVIEPADMGPTVNIDETQLGDEVYTIVSNPEGRCKKGSLIATVRETNSETVVPFLKLIPEEERLKVKEVTMDLSDSMSAIARAAFPNAFQTLDPFHVMQEELSGIENMRLKYKRAAVSDMKKQEREYKQHLDELAKKRARYREKHPKRYKGKARGRKPTLRKNAKFNPERLANGETRVEMLTRSKYLLAKSYDKWTESQKKRAKILFELYPKLKIAYDIVNKLRAIYRSKINKEEARTKLHEWYSEVSASHISELISVRDVLKRKEEEFLNFFINRSSNARAETIHSKIKGFRTQYRGVTDLDFFLFRIWKVLG